MARRWFSRKELTCEAEGFNIEVNALDRAKLNGYRILTTQDLGSTLTMGEIANNPNANGASIIENQLFLQPASASFGGVVTTGTQTFNGAKTFTNPITSPSLALPFTNGIGVGTITQNGERFLSTQGIRDVFLGYESGSFNSLSQDNVGVGYRALNLLAGGNNNVAIGSDALGKATSALSNVCIGKTSGGQLTDQSFNTFIGNGSGNLSGIGSNSIAIGARSGQDQVSGESNWIEIGGTTGAWEVPIPTNGIRIGNIDSTSCFMSGISGIPVANPAGVVAIDTDTWQLGTLPYGNEILDHPLTLNVGTITTMTVRGVSTTSFPLKIYLMNKVVTLRIPAFSITAQSGSAVAIFLTGGTPLPAKYRPNFGLQTVFPFYNSSTSSISSALITVSTGGSVSCQQINGAAFTVPMGMSNDFCITWSLS